MANGNVASDLGKGILDGTPGGALAQVTGGGAGSVVSGVVGGASDVTKAAEALTDPNTWLRVAEFLVGTTLITIGLAAMLKGSPVGNTATKAVKYGAKAAKL